jgi:hypothetical protein
MQALAHRLRQELYVMPSQSDKETLVAELMQSVLKTASNLLDSSQKFGWDDLNAKKRSSAVTSLMVAIEENALLLAETINNEKNLAEATNNILASVRIMRARGVYDQVFPQVESHSLREEEQSSLVIPASALLETSVNGAVRVVFFLYNNMENILPALYRGQYVNSKVMGIVASKGRYEKIEGRPIQFTMRHLVSDSDNTASCVAWDYATKQWTDADCSVVKTNATHTSCQCKRLANYAILSREAASSVNGEGIAAEPHEGVGNVESSNSNLAIIISVTTVALCLLFLLIGLFILRNTDLKPRLDKFIQSKKACFHFKKSDSQTSSGTGLYPALTSSPTSTTVSAGTPTTLNASSNYLVQILEQQAETMKNVRNNVATGNKAMPQQYVKNGTIYQVTAPRDGRNVFRPVSPYGHHIYMEIDPIYQQHLINQQQQQAAHQQHQQQQQQQQAHHQHMESSEGAHSDIQLSDISDDDLRRFSDGRNNARYAEERPLIRGSNHYQQASQDTQFGRHCMTTQRGGIQNGVTLRPVQVGTLQANCNHHNSLRGGRLHPQHQHPHHRLRQPIYHHDPQGGLEAPITIALQGGEQFVSLQIDQQQPQQDIYAGPVHH